MRMTRSRSNTKILPSPILPVFADFSIASIACSSSSVLIAASSFTLGRKSTTYSAPRYSSVWPFCRPNPFTSVTVIPCTPIADSASRTSSSLNGLMIAVSSFMALLLEGLHYRKHHGRLAGIPELGAVAVGEAIELGHAAVALRVGIHVCRAQHPAAQVVGDAELPVVVVAIGNVLEVEDAVVGDQAEAAAEVVREAEVQVVRVL